MSNSRKGANNDKSRIVTKKVAAKLLAVGDNTLDYSGANSLPGKEGFSVVMASTVSRSFMTFHHPIGVTTLDAASWVATETSQIQSLLDRQVDPRRKAIDAARVVHRFASAVTAAVLLEHNGEYYFPGDTTHAKSRRSHVADARRDAKVAGDSSPNAYVSRLPVANRVHETAVRDHLSSDAVVNAAVARHAYPAFQTRSGLHESVEQTAVGYLNQMPIAEAKLAVTRRLLGN
jgi:hypothetical protein